MKITIYKSRVSNMSQHDFSLNRQPLRSSSFSSHSHHLAYLNHSNHPPDKSPHFVFYCKSHYFNFESNEVCSISLITLHSVLPGACWFFCFCLLLLVLKAVYSYMDSILPRRICFWISLFCKFYYLRCVVDSQSLRFIRDFLDLREL